jgi:hypothetical protein
MSGAFILVQKRLPVSLFTFPSLMTGLGQKFSMFVLSHFFSAFFYHTTQFITSFAAILFIWSGSTLNRLNSSPQAGMLVIMRCSSPQMG